MLSIAEKYGKRYDYFRRVAQRAQNDSFRQSLLQHADDCKLEARLAEKSSKCLSESRELLARVNALLSARPAPHKEERSSQRDALRKAIERVFDKWIDEKATPLPRSASMH
jgi:hypothetical protein